MNNEFQKLAIQSLTILLVAAFFYQSQTVNAQELNRNQISLDYGVVRLTSGDFTGFQSHNSYKITLNKFLSIEPGISFTYGSSKSVIARPDKANANFMTKDYPGLVELGPGFGYRQNELDDGFIAFNAHLDKSLYVATDIKVTAGLYSSKHMAEISVGPSIAYIDHSYYIASSEGVFNSIAPPLEITLVQGLYHRFLDYGIVVDLSYTYMITDKFGLGLRIANARYKEKDTILSSSLSLSFIP